MNTRSSACPRVALVGVSGYAQIYLDLLFPALDAGRVQLVAAAVVERDRDLPVVARLRSAGARIHSSYEAMVEAHRGEIDLYLIPTGIQWHARMSIAALRAGANVLVEKPLAGSLADAEAIRDAERETGRWVAVGFQDLYTPAIAAFKAALVDGAIGRLRRVRVLGLWPRSESYFTRNHWAGRLTADGAATRDSPLNNAFAHFVNLALFFAGPSRLESARVTLEAAELFRAQRIESFDTAVVRARSAEGVGFWFGVSHACKEPREPEILIDGEHGDAAWRHERTYELQPRGEPRQIHPVPDYPVTRGAMFNAALTRLSNPDTFVCGTALAIRHTELIEQIHHDAVIRNVPPALIEAFVPPGGHSPVPVVRGLAEHLARAFERAHSLHEVGFSLSEASSAIRSSSS